jgi:hypothetical protein
MFVKVLLNRQEDASGRPAIFTRFGESAYAVGDKLEAVYETEIEALSPTDALNRVFAMFNRGSGLFVGDIVYPQRSLSVGDVVEVDGIRYSCENIGWRVIERCSWCKGEVTDENRVTHYMPATGMTYAFNDRSCMYAFIKNATADNS